MMTATPADTQTRLPCWYKMALAALGIGFLVFGAVVELRGAFLQRRMTDVGVYLRAAWAIRTGADLYEVTDTNGWHYAYPPLLAILLMPLAEPPPGVDTAGFVPYPVSVFIWYVFSVGCLIVSVHLLARVAEGRAGAAWAPRGGPRWWALRVVPVLVCLGPIGHTLMRGQVNLLVLVLLCAMIASWLHGRTGWAGLFLAVAACLKVIPAFLLIYPLWRRDGRCLAGFALGAIVGGLGLPLIFMGPGRTLAYYERFVEGVLRPGLQHGGDDSRAPELTGVNRTDNQAFQEILHNALHPEAATRPPVIAPSLVWAGRLIGLGMTVFTLLLAQRIRQTQKSETIILFGALMLVMVALCPVSHMHYFIWVLPLITGLMAHHWENGGILGPKSALAWFFWFYALANILPHLPVLLPLRVMGLAMYAAVALWVIAVVRISRGTRLTEAWGERETQATAEGEEQSPVLVSADRA